MEILINQKANKFIHISNVRNKIKLKNKTNL